MSRCEYTEECVFFNVEVGYSPDLQAMMRQEFCLGDNSECARLLAIAKLPLDEIPDDLIPTDRERLAELVAARPAGGGAD